MIVCSGMEDTVHLGDYSQCPSTQVPTDVDADIAREFFDEQDPVSLQPGGSQWKGARQRQIEHWTFLFSFITAACSASPIRLDVQIGRRRRCSSL